MDAAASRRTELLGTTVRRMLRRGGRAKLSRLLGRERPGDVAVALQRLTPAEQLEVFQILVTDHPQGATEVLTSLEPQERLAALENMRAETIGKLLKTAPVDDAVFIVESLPQALKDEVLEIVDLDDHLDAVQTHLTYGDDTAGRIMDSEFLAIDEDTTVSEAIDRLRKTASEIDMIAYLYVVDRVGHLLGVVTIRQLLLSDPRTTLGSVMMSSLIKVHTETDQEEVAQLAARYDLLAIPVTDDDNRLVGIVTVDDILDVFKDEATEDFFKMAGTSDDELVYEERTFKVAGIRLPWLLVNLVGLLVAGLITRNFEEEFDLSLLIGFIPVIMGMAGNIGSQTSTIAVRGLATGRLELGAGRILRFVLQQLRVGAVLAFTCAIIVMLVNLLLLKSVGGALVVGPSVFMTVIMASVVGAVAPALFKRLGIDPAVASGPLVTTTNDVLGILIYFGFAFALSDHFVI